ncbi:MAG TPA: ABC transporter permease [Candidatus Caenarcaniphilales bacterium]
MKFSRVLAIATNVFREVLRDRVLYLIGLFAILMVVAASLLPEVSAGAQDKIMLDLGLAAINLLGLVVAVFVGTGLVNREIEKRTALTLIAKPLKRIEFVVGKHLGLSTVLAVLVVLTTAFYLFVLRLNQIQYPADSILIAALYMMLQLCLISAVAILFGVFTSSLLATMLTFATYLMGHFSQDLVTLSRLTDSVSIQRLAQGIYLILPDLSRLDLKNDAVYGALPDIPTLLVHASYGLLYTALVLSAASWIFSYREF